jgi:hypothetical protein
MKRSALAIVTVVPILLTGLTLNGAGWFDSRSRANSLVAPQTSAQNAHFDADACRWRDCQPRHWHDLLVRP